MGKTKKTPDNSIAQNRKAWHDYQVFEQFEAGMVLQGWEVKSIRAGRAQIKESHIIVRKGELWLLNGHISPLQTVSTHKPIDERRNRKLLLHRKEIDKLIGAVERKGFTLVPLSMYWKQGHIKMKLALGKGKKKFDKRAAEKEKDFKRSQQRRHDD